MVSPIGGRVEEPVLNKRKHSPMLGLRLKVALLIHPVFQGEEFKELV